MTSQQNQPTNQVGNTDEQKSLLEKFSFRKGVEYFVKRCMMNRASVLAASTCRTCLRRLSTTEVKCKKPDLSKIREKQELFQQDNGIPVHLKGGAGDYALFYTSIALTMAFKFLARHGQRTLRFAPHNLLRMSTDEPCPPKKEPCPEPPRPKEPSPLKTECSPPPPPSGPLCAEPPPCPPMPQCPPTLCPPVRDPNNPCNYCPPPCIDGDNPDLSKLKKLQCKFQENNGIPVHLKGGKFDVFVFQLTLVLTIVGCVSSIYSTIELILK